MDTGLALQRVSGARAAGHAPRDLRRCPRGGRRAPCRDDGRADARPACRRRSERSSRRTAPVPAAARRPRRLAPRGVRAESFTARPARRRPSVPARRRSVELARRLGLEVPAGPWHVTRDGIATFGGLCGRSPPQRPVRARGHRSRADRGSARWRSRRPSPRRVVDDAAEGEPHRFRDDRRHGGHRRGSGASLYRAMEAGHERAAGEWRIEWHAIPQIADPDGEGHRDRRARRRAAARGCGRMARNLGSNRDASWPRYLFQLAPSNSGGCPRSRLRGRDQVEGRGHRPPRGRRRDDTCRRDAGRRPCRAGARRTDRGRRATRRSPPSPTGADRGEPRDPVSP